MLDGQQYHIAQRHQTTILAQGLLVTQTNWKVKHHISVSYPANHGDSVQMAWELMEVGSRDASNNLVLDAIRRHLLPMEALPMAYKPAAVIDNVYVKVQCARSPSNKNVVVHAVHSGRTDVERVCFAGFVLETDPFPPCFRFAIRTVMPRGVPHHHHAYVPSTLPKSVWSLEGPDLPGMKLPRGWKNWAAGQRNGDSRWR